MSRPRLHQILTNLFEHKNQSNLNAVMGHGDFLLFMEKHQIKLPLNELVQVFTHTSFNHEFKVPDQEQLEFLGDAVLQLILTEELCRKYPEEKEGRLSKLRSSIVNEKTLSRIAGLINLGELILVGKGEFKKGLYLQETVLADTLEALLAQIYRHQGLAFVKKLYLGWLLQGVPEAFDWNLLEDFDAKSKLQELTLARYRKLPRYCSEARGEKFLVELWINDNMVASGTFPSKKTGEKELASDVIKKGII